MGGTLQPPTKQEIEAENRFLKSQLDQVARQLRALIFSVDSKHVKYELEGILEIIIGKKSENPKNQKTPREMWDALLTFKESIAKSRK